MAALSHRLARRGFLGAISEHLAAVILLCHGHAIVARRASIAGVEVDLLVRKGDDLALIEVKSHGPQSRWLPTDPAVSPAQQRRLLRAAAALAPAHDGLVRIHLVLVRWTPVPRITVRWDAFGGAGNGSPCRST